MKRLKRLPIVLILTLLLPFRVSAEGLNTKDFTFGHIGIETGISSLRIFSITHTADGVAWWTTKTGVDRSNGARIDHYSLGGTADYGSLAGRTLRFAHPVNETESLTVFDNSGHIYRYNPVQDRFDPLFAVNEMLQHDVVLNDVLITKEGLFVALDKGIYLIKDGKLTAIDEGIYSHYILPLEHNYLLLCNDHGLTLYKEKRGIITRNLLPCNIRSAYYDARTKLVWMGTYNQGLWVAKLSVKGDPQVVSVKNYSTQIPHNPIRALTPFRDKMLVGVDGHGVYQCDLEARSTEATLFLNATEGPRGLLHGNGIYAIHVDAWENIVIGSYAGGLDVVRPVGSTTAVFQHERMNNQSLINNHVNCVLELPDGRILMGTDDGISIFNRQTGQWQHGGRGLVVLSMYLDSKNKRILAATYGQGVFAMEENGRIQPVYSTKKNNLKDDHVYCLRADREGNLWIGALFGPLTIQTPKGLEHINIDNITSIRPLSDGRMAVGTAHGLYLVHRGEKAPKPIVYAPKEDIHANQYIHDVFETDSHQLWIATDGGGIYLYDLQKKEPVTQLTMAHGLPSNSVSSLAMDRDTKRLWIATEGGLAFAHTNEPEKIVNVNYCYGLQAEYVRGAVQPLQDGKMLFGTSTAAIIIDPGHVQEIDYTAKLYIRQVTVHGDEGKSMTPDELEDFRAEIAQGLAKNRINLTYGQNTFDILIEAINLHNNFDIAYQYKIGDTEWSEPTREQTIDFANLEPGKHKLTIRSVSISCNKTLDEKTLTVHVDNPWWRSWWMRLIYVIISVIIFRMAWKMYVLHERYMRLIVENAKDTTPLPTSDGDVSHEDNNDELRTNAGEDETAAVTEDPGSQQFVDAATKVVLANLGDTDFTVDTLSREMAMSRTLFYVKLKTFTGQSPQDFIRIIRMERAASLLKQGKPVADVARLVGFDNPKYFSQVFKKYFDVSPSKYR